MMSIIMFAIIGATIKAGIAYWICFSIGILGTLIKLIPTKRDFGIERLKVKKEFRDLYD